MEDLETALSELQGIGQRKQAALILELLPAIEKAKADGYLFTAIHEKVNEKLSITISTFRTSYYRAKALQQKAEKEES